MNHFTKTQVGRGAVYLYIENIAAMFSGYIFWLIITKITSPDVIGISATIVSFSVIVVTIVNMGIPISIQRFLGKTFVKQSIDDTRTYIRSSLFLLMCTILTSIVIISIAHSSITFLTGIDLDPSFLVVTILLIVSTSVVGLLRGIIISTLNTKVIPIASIAGSVAKFVLSFLLIIAGFGALGLTIGVASFTILESVFFALTVAKIQKREQTQSIPPEAKFWNTSWKLLEGGFPSWVPSLVAVLGTQLGTILIFGSHGASSAGIYFISYSIYTAISAGVLVIFSITYPVLSTIDDGRKTFSWRTIKLALIISVPFSMSILFHSAPILDLFGREYVSRSFTLEILLLSVAPVALMMGVNNLLYSYGIYRQVMLIGIAISLPRTLLYFVLVPIYGGTGAAISFTIGSLVGLALSVFFANSNNFKILWKQVVLISFTPLVISYLLFLSHIHYAMAILLSITISYLAFISLGVLNSSDMKEAISVLPKNLANPSLKIISSLEKIARKR
ncbi:MAG: oligosaccharide flippase family protein [Nitrososphaeraceae archaeon]|nr:oligosaccharide flippase family protein [Nitrososphaeraceae archaeon]